MKPNLFLSISSLFLLFSCNKPNETRNQVVGHETGIPSVDLSIIYSGNEYVALWDSIAPSLDQVTSVSTSNSSYRLSANMAEETTFNAKRSMSFYGTSKQYAISESSLEQIQSIGKAVTSRSLTTGKTEYAVGDKGKLTYIKSSEVSSSGKESSYFTYNYKEAGGVNLRQNYLPSYTLGRDSSGILGSTKDGRLYFVSYSESISRPSAYNDAGEVVSGLTRTYRHTLFDLNSVSYPRYNSIRSVETVETNIDQDGIKRDEFHVSMETRIETDFTYAGITENEEDRAALIRACTAESITGLQVSAYYQLNSHNISLSGDAADPAKYTCVFEPFVLGNAIKFKFNAARTQIDKNNETVTSGPIGERDIMFNSSVLIRGGYPEDAVTISNSSITFNRYLSAKITFKSYSYDPYLSITSIELL